MRGTPGAAGLIGERVQGIAPSATAPRRFTVTTGPTGAAETHYDGFAEALGMLALHAESGRRARVHVDGLTLAHTTGDHTIHLAGA